MKKSTGFLERISKEELDMMAKKVKKTLGFEYDNLFY